MENDFISRYLQYVGASECPTIYHRWCALSILGTYLGRQCHYKFGHSNLHTNLYLMLIGVPGARKSTAIKICKKVITLAGYDKISADKSSKEKFMLDLAGEGEDSTDDILERNLFGGAGSETDCREMFIACDEFNDFIGNGNFEFISLLGNLWDFDGVFKNRIKTGKSVEIMNPTLSILGGNTQVNFARAFPPDTLGQGFFSRLLLIYSDPTGRKIAEPMPPDVHETADIVAHLQSIKMAVTGEITRTKSAQLLLREIYEKGSFDIDDGRFASYNGRRFVHLLKLTMIVAASRGVTIIGENDVITANTVLSHAEFMMPKALGEFGKSRNSEVTHKVMQIVEASLRPLTLKEIWAYVNTDLEKINDLTDMLRNLITADKIFNAGTGFLVKKKLRAVDVVGMVDYGILTEEERNMIL